MSNTLDDKQISRQFFNEWLGSKGPKGWVSRYISNTGRWYADMLISQSQIKSDDIVLDIGCGSATTIVNVLKRVSLNNPINGIEPSDVQFALAQNNIRVAGLQDKVVLKQGFAAPLPYDDNTFDLVYASFIFKHFSDDTLSETLSEVYRVLKPGGRFMAWEFAVLTNRLFKKLASNPKKAMQNFRTFNDFLPLLTNAGFKEIQEFEVKNRGFWDPVKDVGFKTTK